MQKTTIEIIDETVEYYTNNPRSVGENGACLYRGPNGERCAFSRCCEEEMVEGLLEYSGLGNIYVEEFLKEEYKGKPLGFWVKLQILHDNEDNWAPGGGLSEIGVSYVNELKRKYA